MAPEDLVAGDPVWAKMKGYPPWPAKIVDPTSTPKSPKNKKANYVLFFGTGDYAWILNKNIIPHCESILIEAKSRKKPTQKYLNGIDELIVYCKTYKRVIKQPKIFKKEIVKNNVTESPRVKVVKVLNSVSNKYNRRVLSKSLLKKAKTHRKRSFCDMDRKSCPSEFLKLRSISPTHFSPISDSYSFLHQNSPFNINSKYVAPSHKILGFIGLGMMGRHIVKKLIESGHNINVWNETSSQCDIFVDMGAKKARYPADLIIKCDVTFCCVSDSEASKAVIFGENGIINGLEQAQVLGLTSKGYVEMTCIDHITSQQISEAVLRHHGLYLEAPLSGSCKDAEEGNLSILAAGDVSLFRICETIFHAIGKDAAFVSCDVGDAVKMSLILSTLSGTACAALAEAMVLVERLKLQKSHFLECLQNGPLACKFIIDKAQNMDELAFQRVTALKHVQKNLSLTKAIADYYSQPMYLAAAANEVYKLGRQRGYSNEDMSAVYKVVKY